MKKFLHVRNLRGTQRSWTQRDHGVAYWKVTSKEKWWIACCIRRSGAQYQLDAELNITIKLFQIFVDYTKGKRRLWHKKMSPQNDYKRREGCPIYTNWYDPYNGIFLLARVVRLVNHCFTTRTSRASRGLLYTVSLMIYTSQNVRLVNHCFTTRSISASRTGPETMVYESYSWWGISLERLRVYIQVHDSYDSFGSWNNGLRVVQFVNYILLQGLSGSHALRTKNIRRFLRRASHQYVNI